MQIGVPRETRARETRVAATPKTVEQLVALGYDVAVESGAGDRASFSDEAYAVAGARVVTADEAWGSPVVHKVNAPSDVEIARLRPGTVARLAPGAGDQSRSRREAPRRRCHGHGHGRRPAHQPGAVAGRAVVDGQHRRLPRRRRGRPRVRLVLHRPGDRGGQGAAGARCSSSAPASRVSPRSAPRGRWARSSARPTRGAEVAEQVESMGADFLAVQMPEVDAAAASSDGYAKEMGEEYNRRAAELYRRAGAATSTSSSRPRSSPGARRRGSSPPTWSPR